MAMPFVVRAIRPAHDAAAERHDRLAASLGISGWSRLRLIDWPSIRRPLLTGFAFAMALSLGDLGVIALFGSDAVKTLPFLLLERMGSYRTADAAGIGADRGGALSRIDGGRRLVRKGARMTNASERRGAAIRLADVTFRYADMTMQFDAVFATAGITAVIGPSGSGKSTLLNLIAGFEAPQSGRVLIADIDVTALPPPARPVSMIFQENNLFAHLDVAANVGLGISPALRLTPADSERIATALGRTGLAGKDKRLPRELSGGERQRVALARALVRDRPVLLLDEPFASLGPALREEMLDLLMSVQAERQHDHAAGHASTGRCTPRRRPHRLSRGGAYCRSRRQAVVFRRGRSGSIQAIRGIGVSPRPITLNCPEADII